MSYNLVVTCNSMKTLVVHTIKNEAALCLSFIKINFISDYNVVLQQNFLLVVIPLFRHNVSIQLPIEIAKVEMADES